MKDAKGHGSNTRGGASPGNQLRDQAHDAINRALALAPKEDMGRVDSGGIWERSLDKNTGVVTATHADGTTFRGSKAVVDSKIGHYGMQKAMERAGVGPSHAVAAKHGIPTGHLASAWRSVKRAFHNSDG